MDASTFQREAGNYGVDWTVKFVEAPIDAVSDAYAKFRKCDIARNVSIGTTGAGQFAPTGVIVQPANTDWTVVFHDWSRFAEFPILSGIKARTMEFGGPDGTQARTCNLFTPLPSFSVVRYRIGSVADAEQEYYAASRTPKSSRPTFTIVRSYNLVFEQYKIKLVFVYLDENRQVVAKEQDRPEIVRADVAVIS